MTQVNWAKSYLDSEVQIAQPVPYFGQQEIRNKIQPFLEQHKFPHTLLTGPPGIGKTHLAHWIAGMRAQQFEEHLCPVTISDVAHYGIVFLDEIHRQSNPESLYPLMDNVTVTLIGATTRPESLEPAFRSRFFLVLKLRHYTPEAMAEMLRHYAQADLDDEIAMTFAKASAGNPRQLQRIILTAQGIDSWDPEEVLQVCQVNADGLTEAHFDYLTQLYGAGRPVGVSQLALLLYSDDQTVKEVERLLLHHDLISLTSSGRKLTKKGRRYLEASGWKT